MLASAKTVAAVERLARADRRLVATVDQLDADPMLLNTRTCVIDLRAGDSRPHRPADLLTKVTSVGPGGACPRFLEFLDRVTGGDRDLVGYQRRALGYAMMGSTNEHVLFFLHGLGANGKSVLLTTVSGVVGSYHRSAPIESFIATGADRHPTDIAGLRGRAW